MIRPRGERVPAPACRPPGGNRPAPLGAKVGLAFLLAGWSVPRMPGHEAAGPNPHAATGIDS